MRHQTEPSIIDQPARPASWQQWHRPTCVEELAGVIAHLDSRAVRSLQVLPPASAAEIEDLEVRLGRPLPPELQQLYRSYSGLFIAAAGVVVDLTSLVWIDRIPGAVEAARSSWSEAPWELDPHREVFRQAEVARLNQALLCVGWFRSDEAAHTFLCVDERGRLAAVTYDRGDVLQFRADLLRLVEGVVAPEDPLRSLITLLAGLAAADA